MNIDFVITWVDGSDPAWLAEKAKYSPTKNNDSRIQRYREWNNLHYWFRGVEKFAPWVHKIYFVTYGHYPAWLNLDHPQLEIIKHTDYIPAEYLPTFSSRAIDMNLHRIKNLSEHFVYFNDDMFLTAPVEKKDFFMHGLPCDTAVLNALYFGMNEKKYGEKLPNGVVSLSQIMDTIPINRNFDKNKAILNNIRKWFSIKYGISSFRTLLLMPWLGFTGLMSYHLPYSYLKSTYEEVWSKEEDILSQTCSHKFRDLTDLNHWVFSYWQLAKGTFWPRSPKIGMQFKVSNDVKKNSDAINAVISQKYKFVCLNDAVIGKGFEEVKNDVNGALDRILPQKSRFEK